MRIVVDLSNLKDLVGGSLPMVAARTYAKRVDEERSSGLHISMDFCDEHMDYTLEGDARDVLQFLKEAVALIEMFGQDGVKDGEIEETWNQVPHPVQVEAMGKGLAALFGPQEHSG